MKKSILILMLTPFFWACDDDDNDAYLSPVMGVNDQFNAGKSGWAAAFADYPVKPSHSLELEEGIANLPAPLDTKKSGFRISGLNSSDDLFMYFKKKVSGLKPNQAYTASFAIEFASNAPKGQFGAGGSPDAVTLGIGAGPVEPKTIVGELETYRMNIDKISQGSDGKDMKIIGDIGNGTEKDAYKMVSKSGDFVGKTDSNGNLWLIFGTESAYEAKTTLYYTSVQVKIKESAAVK